MQNDPHRLVCLSTSPNDSALWEGCRILRRKCSTRGGLGHYSPAPLPTGPLVSDDLLRQYGKHNCSRSSEHSGKRCPGTVGPRRPPLLYTDSCQLLATAMRKATKKMSLGPSENLPVLLIPSPSPPGSFLIQTWPASFFLPDVVLLAWGLCV